MSINPILVLNKNWQYVNIEYYKKSIIKGYKDKALFLPDDDFCTYSFQEWITKFGDKKPKVILLKNYSKRVIKGIKPTRRNVILRDEYICQYTGKKLTKGEATVDHVIPLSLGGKNTWENLVCCDIKVNAYKANRTLEESNLKLIRRPFKPVWNPLFFVKKDTETYNSWKRFVKDTP